MFRILLALIGNVFALLLSQALIPGFQLSPNFFDILIIGLILTALNFFLKPVLKLIFGPIIVLTFGLGSLVVNMILLYILDILSKGITIQGNILLSLLLASVIVGVINIIIHWSKK